MPVPNSYPLLPELPYKQTSVQMPTIVIFAQQIVPKYNKEIIKAAYCVIRIESGNGKSGINNNYASIEADEGEWNGLDMSNVVGTCIKWDGKKYRRHLCFDDKGYMISFEFLCMKFKDRGIYIGAANCDTVEKLNDLYHKKWVGYPSNDEALKSFISLYNSATKIFS